MQVEPFLLPIPEQFFDPHAPLVETHDREARREVRHEPPRLLFSFGPMADQIDWAEVTALRNSNVFDVSALSFRRIERPALPPRPLSVGSHVGVRMQTHAVGPAFLFGLLQQINRMELSIPNQNRFGLRRHKLGQLFQEAWPAALLWWHRSAALRATRGAAPDGDMPAPRPTGAACRSVPIGRPKYATGRSRRPHEEAFEPLGGTIDPARPPRCSKNAAFDASCWSVVPVRATRRPSPRGGRAPLGRAQSADGPSFGAEFSATAEAFGQSRSRSYLEERGCCSSERVGWPKAWSPSTFRFDSGDATASFV